MESKNLGWDCTYLENREDLRTMCGEPAVWHGLLLPQDMDDHHYEDEYTAGGMMSCRQHAFSMQESAAFVHTIETACGLPGGVFSVEYNICVAAGVTEADAARLAQNRHGESFKRGEQRWLL